MPADAGPSAMQVEFATFRELEERTAFVARRFARYLQDSVLDVGCYEAPMRRMLNGVRYCGIDITGAPDVRFDLDSGLPLPVGDRSYRCVMCVEVLEHLDHLHAMFGELVRASDEYLIVSLPNPWRDARRLPSAARANPRSMACRLSARSIAISGSSTSPRRATT
jgi:hypothetical protein